MNLHCEHSDEVATLCYANVVDGLYGPVQTRFTLPKQVWAIWAELKY